MMYVPQLYVVVFTLVGQLPQVCEVRPEGTIVFVAIVLVSLSGRPTPNPEPRP